ncbi:putative c-8 sterol isomerase [Diaporthe ampelina]|uniref:C-8 sterol isomerase n=1 Tax=Diaporthe ampelina TaxID=1214573 RepID=A0A0G2FS57_9PEZI|nr:putative c-8 sterol isomerase [Diaporthe ampelina]
MARLLFLLAALVGLLSPVVYLLEQRLESFYIFDKDHLYDLSKRAIAAHGNDTRSVASYIVSELHGNPALANHVNLDEEWIFNNAGGAMGAMYIIHASVTEYLIIFGTPIGTEGHTGRHTADDYFHILFGTQLAYTPGSYEPEVYPQGSVHHLPRGQVKQYKMPDSGCFALEYARGWIPPMLFFGFADGLSSTLDFPTLWRTTWVTGKQMVANLALGKF